ncbi:DUF4479 domain-containing protein, partial [Listeria monocytogenes]|nr:DUF4479 domain-containing protein [Listeria monocytogenes]
MYNGKKQIKGVENVIVNAFYNKEGVGDT